MAKARKSHNKRAKRRPMAVVTPAIEIRLPYAQRINVAETAAGAGGYTTWGINNVFDPWTPVGGQQPLGFDQYSQFYGRYRVLQFKYDITIGNITSASSPVWVGVYYSPQSTLPADPLSWFVQPTGVKWNILAPIGGGGSCKHLRGTVDIARVFGVTRREYLAEMDFAATTSGGPARQAFLHLFLLGQGQAATVTCLAHFDYDVEFSQPVALALS